MPATEQTWRDQKKLHAVFGLTALAMLLGTFWMLAADHRRPWKPYQRQYQRLEVWNAQSRTVEQDTAEYEAKERELAAALSEAQAAPPDAAPFDVFIQEAQTRADENGYNLDRVEARFKEATELAEKDADAERRIKARKSLVDAMQAIVDKAKFDEDKRQRALKFERADLDVMRSEYDLAVGNGLPEDEIARRKANVDRVQASVDELDRGYQQARVHRTALQDQLAALNREVTLAQKAYDDHTGTLQSLKNAYEQQRKQSFWRGVAELPIIDGFSNVLEVKQIWLPKLTLNNNFRDVARFDRCVTCHLGMEKTAPGSAVEPGYHQLSTTVLTLETPEEEPGSEEVDSEDAESAEVEQASVETPTLESVYGIKLADEGLFNKDDPTIGVVWPNTRGARAGFIAGDRIRRIRQGETGKFTDIWSKDLVHRYLLESVRWGEPIFVEVERGVPHPFSSHPRLDLFVGSLSPHKVGEFGCTICHQGQGSATDFKYASHTPNTYRQMRDWQRDHEWFNNHHWILPMMPKRFSESTCLKCHHEVVELGPSERFPEPPAPKLVQGYDTIRQVGCFGCHEIVGYDGPDRRIGPDLRAEPNYFAAAQQLLASGKLTDEEARLARRVVDEPELDDVRKRLAVLLRQPAADEAEEESDESAGAEEAEPRFRGADLDLIALLAADDEAPGRLRKPGPSLRHVASKLDFDVLYRWIRRPQDIRPNSKMPQFFGLWDHLDIHGEHSQDEADRAHADAAQRFEPIEIRAAAEYLMAASQPFEYDAQTDEDVLPASAERGQTAFQVRGCLACHKHEAFPEITATHGPDLSFLGRKLRGEKGQQWLVSWLRDPERYHARTVMPNVFLTPQETADGVVDPAADIAAFLLSAGDDEAAEDEQLPEVIESDLDELALEFLTQMFTERQAREYLKNGIPESMAGDLRGDELELVGSDNLQQKKLLYLGRKTISRFGCAGCHDIPGFETAKPIGVGLNDWGRKEPAKLAFEQILPYLASKQDPHSAGHGAAKGDESKGGGHGHAEFDLANMDPDESYYMQALLNHEREGFIWQKIREPRSYDYRKTENKKYTERLRMPKFYIDDEAREAVITFVLGLVAEPPAANYVYNPPPRQRAIQEGEKLVEKFNCAGCHTMQMEQWAFDFDPETFEDPPPFEDYEFLRPHFTPEQLEESRKVDRRGLGHAVVEGMPNPQESEDDDGNPLFYFGVWKPVAINGQVWSVGGQEIPIAEHRITAKRPPVGGELARYLHPVVAEMGREENPNLLESDVWGWLPPPLVNEGRKVQTDWLHDFLLDPYPIRPAAVLRMPRFNMSADEAATLVNYFAARDNARYPYEKSERGRIPNLAEDSEARARMDDALTIITNNNYCVKCHLIGDFTPQGSAAALAPNLDRIYRRLRPDYLERWIANPKSQLPYTGMPVNFPPGKPADPALFDKKSPHFPTESREQIDAVVDFLLNYDAYMQSQTSIRPLIQAAPPAEQPQAAR